MVQIPRFSDSQVLRCLASQILSYPDYHILTFSDSQVSNVHIPKLQACQFPALPRFIGSLILLFSISHILIFSTCHISRLLDFISQYCQIHICLDSQVFIISGFRMLSCSQFQLFMAAWVVKLAPSDFVQTDAPSSRGNKVPCRLA